MTMIDDAFYQNDFVRVMGEIGKALALDIGMKVEPHQNSIETAEAKIAALVAAGHTPPADLATSTDGAVQAVRDDYEAAKAQAEANLALDAATQDALGIRVDAEQRTVQVADEWLAAIDAVWTPGGGST